MSKTQISIFSVKITQELANGFMIEYKGECIEIERKEGEMLINMLQVCQKIIKKEETIEYKNNRLYGIQGRRPYIAK